MNVVAEIYLVDFLAKKGVLDLSLGSAVDWLGNVENVTCSGLGFLVCEVGALVFTH